MKYCNRQRPIVLCVLDGWGYRKEGEDNAIATAMTPVYDRLLATCPWNVLDASEAHVGLPIGQMGNSEVGHMNIGAGRIVMQDLPRIDGAIKKQELSCNPALNKFISALQDSGGTCHLIGLLSTGGVHSHQSHIIALANLLVSAGVQVKLHIILDGRDVPPKSAATFIKSLHNALSNPISSQVVSLCGRYYAMDRDQRWERVKLAYQTIVTGEGKRFNDAQEALDQAYANDETDEFVTPRLIGDYKGMRNGDGIFMANFRSDRAREILSALIDPEFSGFNRGTPIKFAAASGLVQYSSNLAPLMTALFPPLQLEDTVGDLISKAGFRQLRIAETEKYAHVTFFFNGGRENIFPGEERVLIASPSVKTYDLQPEMSAYELTDRLVKEIRNNKFDFVLVNYANGDMVGHTGDLNATVKAAQTVDTCLGRLEQAIIEAGGTLFITADHGNAESMADPKTGQPHTAHTMNPVPAILVNGPMTVPELRKGCLADIAPTILTLLGLEKSEKMTGCSLLVSHALTEKTYS